MQKIKYLNPPEMVKRSAWQDTHEIRVNNWITPWDFKEEIDAGLVMVPFSRASILPTGSHGAPNAIRQAFIYNTTYSPDFDVDIQGLKVRDIGDVAGHVTDVIRSLSNIENAMTQLYNLPQKFIPLIIGGDHSITAPSVRAFAKARPGEKIGMIHFDAHNDVRNFEDGGPSNGTPIRGIMETCPQVKGNNIVQVGIHGFMNSSFYKQYAESKGITIFPARQVKKQGIENIMQQAVEIAGRDTDSIYLTVDIDVLTFPYAIGTGAATPEGMDPWDLLEAIFQLGQNPKVQAFDLVCIDPSKDMADLTSRMGASIILVFLAGLYKRLKGGRGY